MSDKTPIPSGSPRERFTQFVVLACAEIALVAALLLLFFSYNLDQDVLQTIFVLALALAGSLMIRRGIQIAQIVFILSILLGELILLLNLKFSFEVAGISLTNDFLPFIFVIFDLIILVMFVRMTGMSIER